VYADSHIRVGVVRSQVYIVLWSGFAIAVTAARSICSAQAVWEVREEWTLWL
jgi:hypothetical protein